MSTATLMGRITMDDSDFQNKIRKAGNAGKDFGRDLTKSVNGAALSVKNLVVGFGAFLAARVAVRGLTDSLKAAADFEALTIDFEVFLKDATKAKDLMTEIVAFSDATPFEADDLLITTKNLLAAGIEGEKVVGILKSIAAVAKDGQQVGELGDALAKGFAKGKFQTEELNKFLERGANLLPELAKITGLTGIELSKAVEKGLAFEDVTAAIAALSAEGGLFFGRLDRQSKTATGLVSTLAGGWKSFMREFGVPINDALKPILEGAIKAIASAKPAARVIGEAVGAMLSGMAKIFGVISKAAVFFQAVFTKAIEDISAEMINILPDFIKVRLGIDGVEAEARTLQEIFDDLTRKGTGGLAKDLAEGAESAALSIGAATAEGAKKLVEAGKSIRDDMDEASIIYNDRARGNLFGGNDKFGDQFKLPLGGSRIPGLGGEGQPITVDQDKVVASVNVLIKQGQTLNDSVKGLSFDVA